MTHPHTEALRKIFAVREDPNILSPDEASKMMQIATMALAAEVPGDELSELWDEHSRLVPIDGEAGDFEEFFEDEVDNIGRLEIMFRKDFEEAIKSFKQK